MSPGKRVESSKIVLVKNDRAGLELGLSTPYPAGVPSPVLPVYYTAIGHKPVRRHQSL